MIFYTTTLAIVVTFLLVNRESNRVLHTYDGFFKLNFSHSVRREFNSLLTPLKNTQKYKHSKFINIVKYNLLNLAIINKKVNYILFSEPPFYHWSEYIFISIHYNRQKINYYVRKSTYNYANKIY